MKIETRKPLNEALERRGVHPFATAEDSLHATEIMPGHVVVRCFACRQFESEVGCCRKCVSIGCKQLHPPGRMLQKRHRAREHSVKSQQSGRTNSQNQTHVVIER